MRSPQTQKYRIEFSGIVAQAEAWIRDWPKNPECRQASQLILESKAQAWQKRLEQGRDRLRMSLKKVWAPSSEAALAETRGVFAHWLRGIDLVQDQEALPVTCLRPSGFDEPSKIQNTKLITRLPAKFWGGLYTVRLNAQFGQHTLNGRFLVDTGAERSLVSPQWMAEQGVSPKLVQVIGTQIMRWSGGESKVNQAIPFGVSWGGVAAPVVVFHMTDTSLFEPPAFLGACCDGVIGRDLLRNYAVEFRPGDNPEVLLWDRSQMSWGGAVPWTTVADGYLEDCRIDDGKLKPFKNSILLDSGSDQSIEAPRAMVRASKARLVCPSWTSDLLEVMDTKQSRSRGKVSIGMGVLMQGGFTLDLSNGRIWWSKELMVARERINHTGIDLHYIWNRKSAGDRQLVVTSAPKSSGLKVGDEIIKIDGLDAERLDELQVERRMMGYSGDEVCLGLVNGKSVRVSTAMQP